MHLVRELTARGDDQAIAISAPGRKGLSYAALRRLMTVVGADLGAFGIGANDPVAIVLPNGPEMATAFIAVAGIATAAPLNPAYKADEFKFYLSDLDARVLIIAREMESSARNVAQELGIPVIELDVASGAPAGEFCLALPEVDFAEKSSMPSGAEDTALVLHTSGTTARPKIVPLSQNNICASARHISATLELTADDVCLNIMPLFHIHGLIAAVLSSLSAGASICCTPGFNALKFFAWMDEANPTWYTAVPTMHQAIIGRAVRNQDSINKSRLRFTRSSSASLPPQIMHDLEEVFACPLVEAYGMTEAAHQMACNPLPPAARKPGSVGIAAGPEVAIMDPVGVFLAKGETGEVVIRGSNVTAGYQNNPEANASAYTDGWFRTGDQGVMDADNYLTITGRLKEIINRGGEKISPREVDEVLLDHPAIAQAVTFALPHKKLGEDVGAAVVIGDGEVADEAEIRSFVGTRLASFKVPRKIVILEEIPKGATGKMQRIGLAKKLGLTI